MLGEEQLRDVKGAALAETLPSDAALIEFIRCQRFDFRAVQAPGTQHLGFGYIAFVLYGGDPAAVQMIDLGAAEHIDQLVADFRSTITGETEHNDRHVTAEESRLQTAITVRSQASVLHTAIDSGVRHLRPQPDSHLRARGTEHGSLLRQAVFDQLEPALRDCKRLFIAPDGELARLPFEVLPTGNTRFLIDDYEISYLSVGRDLLRGTAPCPTSSTPPLVVADPDFDLDSSLHSSAGTPFRRLRNTRAEGEHIATLLHVSPLLNTDALEHHVKAARSPHILHLATHGFFLGRRDRSQSTLGNPPLAMGELAAGRLVRLERLENPLLRSGLALAGANTWLSGQALPTEAEDGLLTAEDMAVLDLHATELVVLSACDTALGEDRPGEGVFGLRRAITVAGAKTLVMSLWKVPDQETRELMINFYQRLLTGQRRSEALRAARLDIKKRHPTDPYYWGAFICQGDPGPLVVIQGEG
jgi:CHAT domain-containing protein